LTNSSLSSEESSSLSLSSWRRTAPGAAPPPPRGPEPTLEAPPNKSSSLQLLRPVDEADELCVQKSVNGASPPK
jgi:hypothetical protein